MHMPRLIALCAAIILFGYFSSLNSQVVTISFVAKSFPVPVYVVIGLSFAFGIGVSWILGLMSVIHMKSNIRKKEHDIQEQKQTIHNLTKRVNELEIANDRLKKELKIEPQDELSI